MNFISIIIPVYKCGLEHLRECLTSLSSQTMNNCEFIIVSDGAPEAECKLCNEFADKDSRFVFFHRVHAGVSAARNYGISQAQGEFITFVDSDDWIEKDACEKIYSFAHKCNSDITFWDCSFFDKTGNLDQTSYFNENVEKLSHQQIEEFKSNAIHFYKTEKSVPAITVCKLYKKKFLDKNSFAFNEKLSFGEDRVFSYQQSCVAKKISFLKENLYHCRRHSQSTTKKFTPDAFEKSMDYISILDALTQDKEAIGLEALSEFYTSWNLCYMHKDNQKKFKTRMFEAAKSAQNATFQNFISNTNGRYLPPLQRIELYLLKHRCTFFIWIHGFKHLLLGN